MDVVKNCKTGTKHLALNGNSETLCGERDIDERILTDDEHDKHGPRWEKLSTVKTAAQAIKLSSCANCKNAAKWM